MKNIPLIVSPFVQTALLENKPVLALESTVITHGLPYPRNFEVLHELEATAQSNNAIPATICVIDGKCHIGLSKADITALEDRIKNGRVHKISLRELPLAIAQKWTGGTTVSSTMFLANMAGIKVFSTGGIGGVHRGWESTLDISSDLTALAKIPVIVVCAGCKAILDIPATLEVLESMCVPILGWDCDEFPSFYSRESGLTIQRISEIKQIAEIFHIMSMATSLSTGLLVANPIPTEFEIPLSEIEPFITEAIDSAKEAGVSGKKLTPFLLSYLAKSTSGRSVNANLALLRNNVKVGAQIAGELL